MEEVYLDELFDFIDRIKKRRITDYLMQLSIVQNPHLEDESERRALWEALNDQLNDSEEEIVEIEQPQLDKGAFELMKFKMSNNPKIIIK